MSYPPARSSICDGCWCPWKLLDRRDPLNGVNDDVAIGAAIGDDDNSRLVGGKLKGAQRQEMVVDWRFLLLIHRDHVLAFGVMDLDRRFGRPIGVGRVRQPDFVLAGGWQPGL